MFSTIIQWWVKSWDIKVFGYKYYKNPILAQKAQEKAKTVKLQRKYQSSFARDMAKQQQNNKNYKSNNIKQQTEYPIVLLAGAPGTGKTTLAHVIAEHCGYKAFEINASDDRDAKKITDIINYKTTNSSMYAHLTLHGKKPSNNHTFDKRPPLIIMDEIDGASNTGISHILSHNLIFSFCACVCVFFCFRKFAIIFFFVVGNF